MLPMLRVLSVVAASLIVTSALTTSGDILVIAPLAAAGPMDLESSDHALFWTVQQGPHRTSCPQLRVV
jgi:hypothetical protein